MTEQDWLASDDPARMLDFVLGRRDYRDAYHVSVRKLRLFACGCARLVWGNLTDPRGRWRNAVEVAERYADGGADEQELANAWGEANHANRPDQSGYTPGSVVAATCAARSADLSRTLPGWLAVRDAEQASLLRCVVGNPFRAVVLPKGPPCRLCGGKGQIERPVICGPDTSEGEMRRIADEAGGDIPCPSCRKTGHQPSPWLTPQVLMLAAAAYDERGGVCGGCGGSGRACSAGELMPPVGAVSTPMRRVTMVDCPDCQGVGRDGSGTLDPARLGVLADALEEAGCVGEALLWHLRGVCEVCLGEGFHRRPPIGAVDCIACGGTGRCGPHVRGCHALDVVLGKE